MKNHAQLSIRLCTAILSFSLAIASATPASQNASLLVSTWYGDLHLTAHDDALLIDLLNSDPVQRLKRINQYGVIQLVDSEGQNDESFTRYDHSLGVLYLLRKFGASENEQASGLLHDVSHTVFSHVSDYFYSRAADGNPHFHDSLFISFLIKHNVDSLLHEYNLTPEDVEPKNGQFTRLERELPDLCADRIDYILQGSARRKTLTKSDVEAIIDSLHYDPETRHWYLKNSRAARMLADASMELNQNVFMTGWGRQLYRWTAEALKQLIANNELDREDIFFNKGDAEVWGILSSSKDPDVQALMRKMKSARHNIHETDRPVPGSITLENLRCRVVDPRVRIKNGWRRLSLLDPEFKQHFDAEHQRCRRMHVIINH